MKRVLTGLFTFAFLICNAGAVEAQKRTGGASGKSYSSGGKPASSGGNAGRSYSSGGSKSYSSGSKSSPASSGKSFSSGGKSSPSGSKPPSSPAPSPLGSKAPGGPSGSTGYTSGGGKSYSSGANKSAPSVSNAPSGPSGSTGYSSGGGKSYSAGGASGDGGPGKKPAAPRYDSLAADQQKKAESRSAYQQAQNPKPAYTTPKGDAVTIDPRDRQVEQLRRQLDHERWANRPERQRFYYGPYYGRPVVVYNDPYSSFFWWWLLDQRLEYQALWAYHYRHSMDGARYNDLLARNALLAARVSELEKSNLQRDPTYVPPGVDPDLVYSDEYVDAVYNPQPIAVPHRPSASGSGLGRFLFWLFLLALIGCCIWLVTWLVFIKRWNI